MIDYYPDMLTLVHSDPVSLSSLQQWLHILHKPHNTTKVGRQHLQYKDEMKETVLNFPCLNSLEYEDY